MVVTVLDTSGLTCPLPILKAKKAMTQLKSGDVLVVISTDSGSVADFDVFCALGHHALLSTNETDGVYRFKIQRA